jgi:hypothetical protein
VHSLYRLGGSWPLLERIAAFITLHKSPEDDLVERAKFVSENN